MWYQKLAIKVGSFMALKGRISDLMKALCNDIVERDVFLQIIFLCLFTNQPINICGRSGSGKSLLVRRAKHAFHNNKALLFGRRFLSLPEKLDDFDMVLFQDFDGDNIETKKTLQIIFQEFENKPILITGTRRPESTLSDAGIIDSITVSLSLPEHISSDSLKLLLSTTHDENAFSIPEELQISTEEKKQWLSEIRDISISEDVLNLIGKMSETCIDHKIYISISKWKGLLNLLKALAFFNDRKEVILTDAFLLGMPIWTRNRNKEILVPEFFNHFESILLKDIPLIGEIETESLNMRLTAERFLNASADLYDTIQFAGESCIKYSITIAGETVPLYVPETYISTNESFHPFNELRQKEKRALCNFNGTAICSISIDSSVKGIGLRSMATSTIAKSFEHFARLPAKVLEVNNPEKKAQNQKAFDEFKQSLDSSAEAYAHAMIQLKSIYKSMQSYPEDPFFNSEYYNKIQEMIKHKFEQANKMIQLLKEVRLFMNTPLPKTEV